VTVLDDYSSVQSTLDLVLRHPLFVAALQLLVAVVLAYFGTERWQRWRQRRDFQYQTMSKLSATSMELFVLLADMLSARSNGGLVDWNNLAWSSEPSEKQRQYISRRTAFHALEAEVMASFTATEIMSEYYALDEKAQTLFDLVQSGAGLIAAQYEPTQNDFLKLRKQVFGRMVVEMKLLTWRERRALRKDPAWAIEDHSGLI